MFAFLRCFLAGLCTVAFLNAAPPVRFRLWMAGHEVGGREVHAVQEGPRRSIQIREWSRLERMGTPLETSITQTFQRDASGSIDVSWSLNLGGTPMLGTAHWSPSDPRRLSYRVQGTAPRWVDLPPETLLWPEAYDERLRQAAASPGPVQVRGFSVPLGQPMELDLRPEGPDPLPGFSDTVRFRGRSREGAMASEVTLWISPTHGEIQEMSQVGGLSIRIQRAELPAPPSTKGPDAFFERTLSPLPPHPFLPWLSEATLRWEGPGEQTLPEDPQQTRRGPNRFRVRRALPPTPEEAKDPPLSPPYPPEWAPYLASTSLLPYEDPIFEGLVARLRPRPGASRWELARAITHFVFEWIERKDFTVGFGTALDVAKHPQGDCTEHTLLAVALLRRLGVPARGVTGWVAAGSTFGLHLWVEVHIGQRWIPLDPTFDEAPASALRLKLGTTDLRDLGSVGWDATSTQVAGGRWTPDPGWPSLPRPSDERLFLPDGSHLRLRGGHWKLDGTRVSALIQGSAIPLEAVRRPPQSHLEGATVLEDPTTGHRTWWWPQRREAFLRLREDRWVHLRVQHLAHLQHLLERLTHEP